VGRRKAEPPEEWSQDKIRQARRTAEGMRVKARETHDQGLLKGAAKIEEKARRAELRDVKFDTW